AALLGHQGQAQPDLGRPEVDRREGDHPGGEGEATRWVRVGLALRTGGPGFGGGLHSPLSVDWSIGRSRHPRTRPMPLATKYLPPNTGVMFRPDFLAPPCPSGRLSVPCRPALAPQADLPAGFGPPRHPSIEECTM